VHASRSPVCRAGAWNDAGPSGRRSPLQTGLAILLLGLAGGPTAAQDATPPNPPLPVVHFTEARAYDLRSTLRLSGSVEAPRSSIVATEVQGVVEELLVHEGDRVDAGSPLVQLRREPLELALRAKRGELAEAKARRDEARQKLERYRELFAANVTSQEEVDAAAFDHQAWQGRLDQLQAEVARLERDLEQTTVRAPFAGFVYREHTQVGQWLAVGDPVVELVSLDRLRVRIEVPSSHFGKLRPGSPATVAIEGNGHPPVTGRIQAVVPRANLQARTFPVLVALPASARGIGVGMLADVELPLGQPAPAVIVPKDALILDRGDAFVYLLRDDDTVARVAVKAGAGAGDWIAVEGEVAVGDRVVIRGNERLEPGQRVRAEPREYPLP